MFQMPRKRNEGMEEEKKEEKASKPTPETDKPPAKRSHPSPAEASPGAEAGPPPYQNTDDIDTEPATDSGPSHESGTFFLLFHIFMYMMKY